MKTTLQKLLATVAPSIRISTTWEHDVDLTDIREDCDGMDDENPDDWQAWQSCITAECIHNGETVKGTSYLGGTWGKSGDNPAEVNPDISGYEWGMTSEALRELLNRSQGSTVAEIQLCAQIGDALESCKRIASESYERQRAEIEAKRADA